MEIKYKLYIKLEREGSEIEIHDKVDSPFVLDDYIYEHDLEEYSIIKLELKEL